MQRPFAGQMTAAGKIPPARVMVVGAGTEKRNAYYLHIFCLLRHENLNIGNLRMVYTRDNMRNFLHGHSVYIIFMKFIRHVCLTYKGKVVVASHWVVFT